jgi:hypothetical protein
MDLWDWFVDLWFIARLRQYLQDRAYRSERERAWGRTQIVITREGQQPPQDPKLPGASM